MLTHELIQKHTSENHILKEDSEENRKRIMQFIKSNKGRNTTIRNNEECNISQMSTRSIDSSIRPRLAVSHTVCKYF